jgi:thioredoxin reductase
VASIAELPVAVVGAGPVGLAAAAHLIERGVAVKVYEAGTTIGAHLRDWGHVRIFTPWKYSIDAAAAAILRRHGWRMPPSEALPTGDELCAAYLNPLAATPEMAAVIETGARVRAISRHGIDKVLSPDRADRPFALRVAGADGTVRRELARAVIDASGTWTQPNPAGADGLPADGEIDHAERIAYGVPDVLGRQRALYAGRHTLVIGAGYSAANVLLDLVRLADDEPRTAATWVTRRTDLSRLSGGPADQLPARGEFGWQVQQLVAQRRIAAVPGFATRAIRAGDGGLLIAGDTAEGRREIGPVDRIIVATGQRPDPMMTRELRLELDPWLECTRALGPLIDPNLHSCGTVPPHGHAELAHPEPGYYAIGAKSYGRAPTFLLLTGYEQARSVAAALAGDLAAADDLRLVLPETGVCQSQAVDAACCGADAAADKGVVATVAAEQRQQRCCAVTV